METKERSWRWRRGGRREGGDEGMSFRQPGQGPLQGWERLSAASGGTLTSSCTWYTWWMATLVQGLSEAMARMRDPFASLMPRSALPLRTRATRCSSSAMTKVMCLWVISSKCFAYHSSTSDAWCSRVLTLCGDCPGASKSEEWRAARTRRRPCRGRAESAQCCS